MCKELDISILKGKTLVKIDLDVKMKYIRFIDSEGNKYIMFHEQDCCEEVYIESISGKIDYLLNTPITMAECVTKKEECGEDDWGTATWTFYKLATIKGYVTIRWYGESNGYYSGEDDFGIEEDDDIWNPEEDIVDLSKRQ